MITTAKAYADRGWAVFPCRPQAKQPLTVHGVKDATRDYVQLGAWWKDEPDANIGIATGSVSGIYVLDLDGQDGINEWDACCLIHGDAPTLTARTGGGGLHLYYALPGGGLASLPNTVKRLGQHIDSRGDGGYVLAPPSVHESGRCYTWLATCAPAPLPAWVIAQIRGRGYEVAAQRRLASAYLATGNDAAAVRALGEECEAVARAQPGHRNETLHTCAVKMGTLVGGGDLRAEDAYLDLLEAALVTGLPEPEARRTIESGLRFGISHPRMIRTRQAAW
jgi:hypothetical protein